MLGFTVTITAQEKYAVLITGDYAAKNIPKSSQWNQGKSCPAEEFWNDTYLMWEMLVFEKGYSDENVFVLFADGEDFYFEGIAPRYTPGLHDYDHVTDYPAIKDSVELVFNGLANGSNGLPLVTEDDFLFVWTFDHGGPGDTCPHPHEDTVYLCLMNNEKIWDWEFAALTDQINCNKKFANFENYSNITFSE